MILPDAHRRLEKLTETKGRIGMVQFKHSRCLGCHKIIQHAQRTNDHTAEQKSAQVDLGVEHLKKE